MKELRLNEVELILIYDGTNLSEKDSLEQLLEASPVLKKDLLESSSRNPGGSRNLGLEAVTGEWFLFCDADDLPEVKNLVQAIGESNPQTQIIVGQYKKILDKANQNSFVSKTEKLAHLQYEPGLWRMLFRSSEFSQYRFPNSKMGEDQVFLLFCLLPKRTIQFTELLFYNYFCDVQGQLTRDKNKFEELAHSIRFGSENLSVISQLSRAEAEFSFAVLVRMLFTYLFKSHRVLQSIKLSLLVWTKFRLIPFSLKSLITFKIVVKTLATHLRHSWQSTPLNQ